jgi:cytosine/adenosine deaminase-related metal-dependent hydrolase
VTVREIEERDRTDNEAQGGLKSLVTRALQDKSVQVDTCDRELLIETRSIANGDVEHLPDADRKVLSDSGATIAHLPWVKARQSSIINSFEKYRRAGVRVALGTDTYPFDMFNEMRFCAIMCKVVESNHNPALAPHVCECEQDIR